MRDFPIPITALQQHIWAGRVHRRGSGFPGFKFKQFPATEIPWDLQVGLLTMLVLVGRGGLKAGDPQSQPAAPLVPQHR